MKKTHSLNEDITDIQQLAGLNEAGDDYEQVSVELNNLLSGLGYYGRDIRTTKEAINSDGGTRIMQDMIKIKQLLPAYNKARKAKFGK